MRAVAPPRATCVALLALIAAAGCYRSHQRGDAPDAATPRDAAPRADAFRPRPDAGPPDAGPTLDCDTADPLELAAALERLSELAGLALEGEGGPGVIAENDLGTARIVMEDGREARFTVTDPELLARFWPGQSVRVERRGAWDVLTDGVTILGVHVATVFQVGIPPFEPMGPISREARFDLIPFCEIDAPTCGPTASARAFALAVDMPGEPDFLLGPNDSGERGGIDRWRVHFRGAAELAEVVEPCLARVGLHAIVEVEFEMSCIC